MMKTAGLWMLLGALSAALGTELGPPAHAASPQAGAPRLAVDDASVGWVVDRADNICGLDDARMLSSPARLDYASVLDATAEMRQIRDEKIDPSSSRGIQLRQSAVDRVRRAAEKVRSARGYCSVWKQIRHRDGRAIPDVTQLVLAEL